MKWLMHVHTRFVAHASHRHASRGLGSGEIDGSAKAAIIWCASPAMRVRDAAKESAMQVRRA